MKILIRISFQLIINNLMKIKNTLIIIISKSKYYVLFNASRNINKYVNKTHPKLLILIVRIIVQLNNLRLYMSFNFDESGL